MKNKEIIILKFIINGERTQFILTSLSEDKYHNINTLCEKLKNCLKNFNCQFIVNDGYVYDNGMGISEKIQHNSITKNIKKIITNNILQSKNYFRNIW